MKVDDDTIVFPDNLLADLSQYDHRPRLVLGRDMFPSGENKREVRTVDVRSGRGEW